MLAEWGYTPVPGPNLEARHPHGYLAGTAEARTADLTWALTAPEIDAVWIARGGYGCVHCLPFLPWPRIAPRPVIGFSDVTSLLLALSQNTRAVGIHAPTLDNLAEGTDAASREALRELLANGGETGFEGRAAVEPGIAVEGPVLGGNLCVLASLAGTPWALQAEGALLVLEDVGEPAYRLDRMVTQLLASGDLDGVRAILLGEFLDCPVPEGLGYTLEELLIALFAPLGVPVVTGLPVGHGQANRPWYYSGWGRLAGGVLRISPPL
jgi:muramoyltetrapeptide carboxypeptidase